LNEQCNETSWSEKEGIGWEGIVQSKQEPLIK